MLPLISPRGLALLALCWLGPHVSNSAAAEPGFRRFSNSISPDSAYVLAWGWGSDPEKLETLKEWPAGADTARDLVENYLVDAVRGKVVAVIPEHDHYVTSEGKWKQFSGLAVTWSEDGRQALAIYEGRWSDESILLIDPKKRTFAEVLPQLHQAYTRFLAKSAKLDEPEISFNMPALLPGGVLVIHARALEKVNEPPRFSHVLKLQMKGGGIEPSFTLLSAHKDREEPDDEKVEDELNKAYQQLRSKLSETARATLKGRQLAWLKQREALPASERVFFTRMRLAHLRAQTEN